MSDGGSVLTTVPCAEPLVVLNTAFSELVPVPPCLPDVWTEVELEASSATLVGAALGADLGEVLGPALGCLGAALGEGLVGLGVGFASRCRPADLMLLLLKSESGTCSRKDQVNKSKLECCCV